MRWPLVSRARLNAAQAQIHTLGDTLRAVRTQLTAEIREAERARVDTDARIATMVPREQLVAAEQHVTVMRELHAREAARVDALTKVILRMKEHGAVLLPPSSVQAQRKAEEARTPTPIEKAIDDNPRARSNPVLRRRLREFAEDQQRRGVKDDVIVERLTKWSDPTHDEDPEESAFD